jgi:ribokinase
VTTEGARGGTYSVAGGPVRRYEAVSVPGPVQDTYGAGDSFAAGLTFGLAQGLSAEGALALGARCGAEALARRGAHGTY